MKNTALFLAALTASVATAHAQSPRINPTVQNPYGAPGSPAAVTPSAVNPAPAQPDAAPAVIPQPTSAAPTPINAIKNCVPLMMPQGVTREFNASVNVSAHLVFPLPIAWAHVATSAWTEDHHGNDLWVRPMQSTSLADTVGLTVAMTDGRRFDFTVKSVQTPTSSCYLVIPYPFIAPNAGAWTPEQLAQARQAAAEMQKKRAAQALAARRAEEQRHAAEEAAYQQRFETMKAQVMQQAEDRIKQFQMALHTNYFWPNHDLITAVYDDGQTTYVRVARTGFGVPVINGKHEGQSVALQYDYDDLTGVYVIPGLFDKLTVTLGTNQIKVERRG
ncbi:TrbG/VirB9 family P-type conjugative transfer protein [Gluconacetobacter diazotrophicus]|uniref:Conjugal transfer protein n=1 Tax=Gluconacetobacter diazotrophicus (strain ATCC 49037 / DSM 5601 / CCUG 37298 / CIP 103539 / LMG 7603 / PAl5) TaxID=272568 RepID=A9HSZ4_GLUDA|nr:TrbG/VirB9 family P-type conjugative transfer protein [Gluconacetobacter diazotrophicus]CAP57845.1 hypothetical protein GDI3881 [Gluconacetobacter diazotrophicus PA1 5]